MNKSIVMVWAVLVAWLGCSTVLEEGSSAELQTTQVAQASESQGSPPTVPTAPWPAGDELGMGNTQGRGTWFRCALEMMKPKAQVFELAHLTSNTMPQSPFSNPVTYSFKPTTSLPFTKHVFNGELVSGELAHQGTQFDSLGHFGFLPEPWNGVPPIPVNDALYYSGYTQADVKPTPDSPLLKLGTDKVPPIVTSAVFLDAMVLNNGEILPAGFEVTADHINQLLTHHGLASRGILPGDAVFIRTGWQKIRPGGGWQDPVGDSDYYHHGPGLAYSGIIMLEEKNAVIVGLDNPFTDPVTPGQFQGQNPPPQECPEGLPVCIHHYALAKAGIYQIQNANLSAVVDAGVTTACTMILPLRTLGGTGSPVRPVAIGTPGK
jgi:kynurenine formamidase